MAEPVSRDKILRREQGQEKIFFPVQFTTSRIGSHARLIHSLLKALTIHTYIYKMMRPFRSNETHIVGRMIFFMADGVAGG